MRSNSSVGLKPSGPTSLVSLSICCLIPATRISKNSSKFELKIVRNLIRSMSGWGGSCASSSTRRLNSSQRNSRLIKFPGSEKRFASGTSFRRSSTPAEGSSATLVLAAAVGIYLFVESVTEKRPRTRFKQPLLGKLGKSQTCRHRRVTPWQRELDVGCLQRRRRKLPLRQY